MQGANREGTYFVIQANSLGIKGDLKGNGLQAGGTYVVEKGGKVLFEHKQQSLGDHPKLEDILNSLGISGMLLLFKFSFMLNAYYGRELDDYWTFFFNLNLRSVA